MLESPPYSLHAVRDDHLSCSQEVFYSVSSRHVIHSGHHHIFAILVEISCILTPKCIKLHTLLYGSLNSLEGSIVMAECKCGHVLLKRTSHSPEMKLLPVRRWAGEIYIYKTISSYCTRKSSQDGMKTFFYCTSDETLIESKHLNWSFPFFFFFPL